MRLCCVSAFMRSYFRNQLSLWPFPGMRLHMCLIKYIRLCVYRRNAVTDSLFRYWKYTWIRVLMVYHLKFYVTCLYICIYIYIYIYIYIHTYIHTHTYIYIHTTYATIHTYNMIAVRSWIIITRLTLTLFYFCRRLVLTLNKIAWASWARTWVVRPHLSLTVPQPSGAYCVACMESMFSSLGAPQLWSTSMRLLRYTD